MRRLDRFAQYTFLDWPDEGLLAANRFLRPMVTRLELNLASSPSLLIELRDMQYSPDGRTSVFHAPDGSLIPDPNGLPGTLRLTWEGRVFALETYEEFYSQPYGERNWAGLETKQHTFYEVRGEPDAWVEEMLTDNPATAVFPPYGEPIPVTIASWGKDEAAPTSEELAELQVQAHEEARKRYEAYYRQPLYRHLFIASESHMIELLTDGDLPTWSWLPGP